MRLRLIKVQTSTHPVGKPVVFGRAIGYFRGRSLRANISLMMTIRRIGCDAAVIGWLAVASIVLLLPKWASAQADVSAASRLHVELPSEAVAVPEPAPATGGAASEREHAVHTAMGQTAHSARKSAASVAPASTARVAAASTARFMPPTRKPAQAYAGPQENGPRDGPPEPAPTQAAGTHPPPDEVLMPGLAPPSGAAEPSSVDEVMAARRPEAADGEIKASDLQAEEQQAGDQQAALAPGPIRPDAIASLAFAPDSAALSGDAEGVLKDLARRFPAKDEAVRLQLLAYAGGEDISASKARRLSLARALAVRSFLMANGIDGARMDVRALGDRIAGSPGGSPVDRVDIAMIRR